MRTFVLGVVGLAMAATTAAAATAPAAPPPIYRSAADVAGLIAKSASQRKDGVPVQSTPIIGLAPYVASLEYRTASAPPAIHETEAEMFYVIDGSGTLVTGGKLVGETRQNAENLRGTGIEGGSPRALAKGDFVIVPENTPHQITHVDGQALVLMSFHVPHKAAAAN